MPRIQLLLVSLALVAAGMILPLLDGGEKTTSRQRSGAMQSLEFWAAARSYPFGDIASDRYQRAVEWGKGAARIKKPLPFAGSGWSYIGPTNLAGRMLALAVNPLNTSTIYAGSASGGLWRSRTGGVAGDWERIVTGFPVLGVAAIAIDPSDTNVMYIGTGEVYRYGGTAGGLVIRTTRGSYGMGILKTTDAGATWSKSLDWSYEQQRGVQAIRLNPVNPSTVWAATTEGIYVSTDAGGTWSVNLAVQMAQDILVHPADTLSMLSTAGNLATGYVLKTTDGGGLWFPVTPADYSGKSLLAQYGANPDIVFASIADSTTGVGALWGSTDFGSTWAELSNSTTNNIFGVQGWYSHFVAVHPLDSSIVFHAGVPASRSTNGGVSFSGVGGTYSDHHAYAWDPSNPSILYVANDDGIYRSTNAGTSFTSVGENLGTGQFYNGFSSSASDSLIALGQVQDHIPGYIYEGLDVWDYSAVDEVGWTAIDQTNDFIMYAGTRNGGAIRKSTNRGVSFGVTGGGFTGVACWNAPFVLSPSNPNILYFGRSRIFRSTNASASWSATNGGAVLDGNPALSMAVSATDPDRVYVGTAPRVDRTHLFTTTDGGATWTDVTGPLPDRFPLDIAVDPADPDVAYVGYGGYGTGHAFKTTDGGATWTDIGGSLPDIPVTAFLVDPVNSSVVYMGTDLGVHISTNGGGSWELFSDGLPEAVLVSDLSLTPSNRTLRAVTHGNSVWERKVPAAFPHLAAVIPAGGENWQVGSTRTISWTSSLVPSVKLDYSTDNGSSWTVIAASAPAYPDSFSWTVPATLSSLALVRVSSTSDTLLAAQSAAPFTIDFDGVILPLQEDWNLVSLPMEVSDPSRQAVFPGSSGKAYRYDGGYASVETLQTGHGYWVKIPGGGYAAIGGDSLAADTIPIVRGWNLVGSLSAPFPAAAALTEPAGILSTPFYSYDGSYAAADTLLPAYGHWVKSDSDGVLILSGGAVMEPAASRGRSIGEHPPAGRLTITDASGSRAVLGIVTGTAPAGFELPPLPPPGAFDVRSAGGTSIVAVPAVGEGPGAPAGLIRTQALSAPATLSWDLPPDRSYRLQANGAEKVLMRGSGSIVLSSVEGLQVRSAGTGGALPAGLHLSQNYPNPFNPSTTIRFSVPEADERGGKGAEPAAEQTVSLHVYDAAGRLVATLLDGPVAAGDHALQWGAGSLPGGVYFAALRSAGGSRSIKMLLLK